MKEGINFHIDKQKENKNELFGENKILDSKFNNKENYDIGGKEKENNILKNKNEIPTNFSKKKHRQKSRNKIKDNDSNGEKSIKKNHKKKIVKHRNLSQTKTKDSGTINSGSTLKEIQTTQDDKNNFDFYQNIWNIIFLKKIKNEKGEIELIYEGDINKKNLRRNIINNKIKILYNLLITHMKYLKEKVLLEKGKLYFFEKIEFYLKKFQEIERYIINCILLIKFFLFLGDPMSLIKANQTLNYLAKELLDYNPNGGLLVYSINTIMKKCINLLKIRKYYRSIHIPYEIIKKYLLLISALIKISNLLGVPRLYHKFLNHYAQIFEVALFLLTQQHFPEKIILKSNLLFNTGTFLIEKNLIKSALKLFEEVINFQGELEHKSFIYYASYYNCSILYYVMGDMKNTENFLGNILNITDKAHYNLQNIFLDSRKHLQNLRNFECKLLIFSAEYNMERENYLNAIENLRKIIKILEEIYRRGKNKKQENKNTQKMQNYKGRIREEKKSGSLRRKMEKLPYEFLFEVEFYENPLEKMLFNEKIKEIVSGLFDAILFLQKEKEIKIKEKLKPINNYESEDEFGLKRNYSDTDLHNKKGVKNKKKYKSHHHYNFEKLNSINDKSRRTKRSGTFCKIDENLPIKTNSKEENNLDDNIEEKDGKPFLGEKNTNLILNYFKDEFARKIKIINNDGDNTDFKYFVILLSNLSIKQIEILNNTQNADVPIESFYNLPIFFSSQFKNSLNKAQKSIFDKLNFLSLIRCKILADPGKKIGLNNINFKIFKSIKINTNLKLKNYNDMINKIKNILNTNPNKKYINKEAQKFNQNYNKDNNNNNEENMEYKENKKHVKFKYKNEINFEKFKKELIKEVKLNYFLYSQEEIDNILQIIESKIFIELMNRLDLKDIKEIKKDKSLLIEILNNELKKNEISQSQEDSIY